MIRFARKTMIVMIIILFIFSIGFISEKLRKSGTDEHSPPGNFVDYQQTNIHYIKKGAGNNTVVFDSGNGTSSPYADMYYLQEQISAHTETIIYERPGYGWSESTSNPRSVEIMTNEMEQVLDEATDNESFIFVAHSMASLEVLSYAHRHPEKVAGIVLIDGVHPTYASEMGSSVPVSIHLTKFLKNIGGLRLLSQFEFFQDNLVHGEHLPNDIKSQGMSFTLDHMWNKNMLQERKYIPENGKKLLDEGSLGDVPLIIISAQNNPMDGWEKSQKSWIDMSDNVEQVWIDTDNHFIHQEDPHMIVKYIKELLK